MISHTRTVLFVAALLAIGCCPTAPPHVCTEINQRTFSVERA